MVAAPKWARTSSTTLIRVAPSRARIRRRIVTVPGRAGMAKASRLSMTASPETHRLFQINERGE